LSSKSSSILNTYTLEELLELNDLTVEDALDYLLEHKFLVLPEYLPVDLDSE